MNDIAIHVENLSKRYRIGAAQRRHDTLRDAIADGARSLVRPFRKNGATEAETLWALRDVSFEIRRGEVVGIIGRNGAGKSTLLKILSRITKPTQGWADVHGRVGSLLDVGTGFHSELTGRENIFLNGAILGMKRAEIDRKFDEIVAFAEVERFIDTPVKHYSSGMYLRLAFAVAAHLEPDIILVDEVLAVGDAEFQKKCLGKMGDVAKEGRTIVFVSHNMYAINQLCSRAIWLQSGKLLLDGVALQVTGQYLASNTSRTPQPEWAVDKAPGTDGVKLLAVRLRNSNGEIASQFEVGGSIVMEVDFMCARPGIRVNPAFHIYADQGIMLFGTANLHDASWGRHQYDVGVYRAACTVPANLLNKGRYAVHVLLTRDLRWLDVNLPEVVSFEVVDTGREEDRGDFVGEWLGMLRVVLPWTTHPINGAKLD